MLESGTLSLGDSRLKNAWGEFLQLCTIYGCVSHVYTNGTFLPVLLHYMVQGTARTCGGPIQQRSTVTGVIGQYQSADHCPNLDGVILWELTRFLGTSFPCSSLHCTGNWSHMSKRSYSTQWVMYTEICMHAQTLTMHLKWTEVHTEMWQSIHMHNIHICIIHNILW